MERCAYVGALIPEAFWGLPCNERSGRYEFPPNDANRPIFSMRLIFVCIAFAAPWLLRAEAFPGWQGLRVIKAQNGAYKMTQVFDGEGTGGALMVIDTRQSRLDFYRFVGESGKQLEPRNFDNPNYLPMAEDFEKTEEALPRLPYVAEVFDTDGDGIDEILLVEGDPRKLVLLKRSEEGWTAMRRWEISSSELSAAHPVIARRTPEGVQVLISFQDGAQIVDAESDLPAAWLEPREKSIERNRWWFLDLDGDGDEDIVEALNTVSSPVRWYEAEGQGFRPAVNISEDVTGTNVARVYRSPNGPRVAFLGATQSNTLSAYELGLGEESELGRRNLLPLGRTDAKDWASLRLEGRKAIVELGADKPVLNLFEETDGFWKFRDAFPVLRNVKKTRALRGDRAAILFWIEAEGQPYISRWEAGRFTFPRPFDEAADASAWKLIALDQYERDTWWITQKEDAFSLNIWSPGDDAPREVVFPGVKGEYDSCVWLGGEALLVKKKFAKTAEICRLADGVATFTPSRFNAADIDQIRLQQGTLYLAKDGVVQKLDESLQVVDQIMLDGDATIRAFAAIDARSAYALETAGEHVHLLEVDETGIYRSTKRIRVPYSLDLRVDPALGLTLVNANHINVPSPGRPIQLSRVATVDPNEGARRSYERATINTLFVVDIDGDGIDEIAAADYAQRNIIVYRDVGEAFEEVISWKVFDDAKYPYGADPAGASSANPYRMLSFDIDGDSAQDLVLASHDRILIYLAKDSQP